MKPDRESGSGEALRLALWPPQQVKAVLHGKSARLDWKPPKINAEAVGCYEVERITWWPGRPTRTTVLGRTDGAATRFEDAPWEKDRINEYRVRAVHRQFGIPGTWSFPAALYGFPYTGYDAMVAMLHHMGERWPEVCRIVDGGPASREPYRIWSAVLGTEIGDHPDRPGILLVGNVHAGELDGGEVCLGVLNRLLEGWEAGDEACHRLLEQVQLRVIPFYNPAGRSIFESGFCGTNRKNLPARRTPVPVNPLWITSRWPSDSSEGIDPNRSFDVNWEPGANPGSPRTSTYAGAEPWLAPEAKAMAELAAALRPQISVHYHGPGGYSLIPGNWRDGSPPLERPLHLEVAREFARLSNPEFSNGLPEQVGTCGFASFQGAAHDWCYQEFYGVHVLAEGFSGHVPKDDQLLPVAGSAAIAELVETNLQALFRLGERVTGAGLELHVRDAAGRPLVARVEIRGALDPHCKPQFTDPVHGAYRRILPPGDDYGVVIRCDGYADVRREGVSVPADRPARLTVEMEPATSSLP